MLCQSIVPKWRSRHDIRPVLCRHCHKHYGHVVFGAVPFNMTHLVSIVTSVHSHMGAWQIFVTMDKQIKLKQMIYIFHNLYPYWIKLRFP
jgi:hypothetical protein